MIREIVFRTVAGILALGIIVLPIVIIVGGDLPLPSGGLAQVLSMLVGVTVLATYAVGGAEHTFPRFEHILWLIEFPEQAWGWLTRRNRMESLSWTSGITRSGDALAPRSGEGAQETQREGESDHTSELLALHNEFDVLHEAPSAAGVAGLVLVLALFLFVLTSADLGVLTTLGVTLLLSIPGWPLVIKDLRRRRNLRRIEQRIHQLESAEVSPRSTPMLGSSSPGPAEEDHPEVDV